MDFASAVHVINPVYSLAGFCVGALVGMTGMGGGSLMTPMLILLFGIHPSTAVGTDLLYAAATKIGGTVTHSLSDTIDWQIVGRLAAGSVPTAALVLVVLSRFDVAGHAGQHLVGGVVAVALLATAVALIFRHQILSRYATRMERLGARRSTLLTVALGAALGILVPISSIGAGALGATILLLLYPRMHPARIVGSDIAHAVPLTLVSGLGHWILGSIDWPLLGSLLTGSLPGIVAGSCMSTRVPECALRFALAAMLFVVAGKLLY
jgi:uncharacterized membrane protein YfcA